MAVSIVERELYTISDAARILRMPPSTLRWWLEGKAGHDPVIRDVPTGSGNVTWGEFVEAGFLRGYRLRGVSLQHIRRFIELLRYQIEAPYPLAHARPLTLGRRLVLEAQREAGLDEEPLIYEALSGQYLFLPPIEQYIERIDFAPEGEPWALRLHPAGRQSPVIIDPDYAFGAPTVQGIRTEVLAELLDAGETAEEVAQDYELTLATVRAAAAYEWSPDGEWATAAA